MSGPAVTIDPTSASADKVAETGIARLHNELASFATKARTQPCNGGAMSAPISPPILDIGPLLDDFDSQAAGDLIGRIRDACTHTDGGA